MTAKRVRKAAILVCADFMALSLPGVGSTTLGAPSNRETRIQEKTWERIFPGTSLKIPLFYDREGEVLETKGLNQDRRKLLEGTGNFAGTDCDIAVRRLVKRMDSEGWFHGDKNEKKLFIESEKGSVYPRADFMKEIEEVAWETVNKNSIDITIALKSSGKQSEQLYIGKNKAKRIAIKELGLRESELTYKGYDLDDDVYGLRFLVNGRKLEIDVNAATGRIVDVDWDNDTGVWDDDRLDDDNRSDNDDRFDDDDRSGDDDDRDDDDDHDDDDGGRHDDDHDGNSYDG